MRYHTASVDFIKWSVDGDFIAYFLCARSVLTALTGELLGVGGGLGLPVSPDRCSLGM